MVSILRAGVIQVFREITPLRKKLSKKDEKRHKSLTERKCGATGPTLSVVRQKNVINERNLLSDLS